MKVLLLILFSILLCSCSQVQHKSTLVLKAKPIYIHGPIMELSTTSQVDESLAKNYVVRH